MYSFYLPINWHFLLLIEWWQYSAQYKLNLKVSFLCHRPCPFLVFLLKIFVLSFAKRIYNLFLFSSTFFIHFSTNALFRTRFYETLLAKKLLAKLSNKVQKILNIFFANNFQKLIDLWIFEIHYHKYHFSTVLCVNH